MFSQYLKVGFSVTEFNHVDFFNELKAEKRRLKCFLVEPIENQKTSNKAEQKLNKVCLLSTLLDFCVDINLKHYTILCRNHNVINYKL